MWLVIAAWVASLLVFSTFFMQTMIPLRVVGIASNVAFMSYALLGLAYGVFGRVYPILVLHACLLPLNVIRLRQLRRLVQAVHSASGEVGLLAAPGRRSLTALCEGGCLLSTITKEKALELYHQNPSVGMFLIRLVSGYALDDAFRGPTSPTGERPPGNRPDPSTGHSVSDIDGS